MLYQQLINFPGSVSKNKLSTDPNYKNFPEIYSEIKPGTWMYFHSCINRRGNDTSFTEAIFKLGSLIKEDILSAQEYYQVFSDSDYVGEGKISNNYCKIHQASVATNEQITDILIRVAKFKKLTRFIPLNGKDPYDLDASRCFWHEPTQSLINGRSCIIYFNGKWASPFNEENLGEFVINGIEITVDKRNKQIKFGSEDSVSFTRISMFFEPLLRVGEHQVTAKIIKIGCTLFTFDDYLKIKNYINS